MKGFRSRGLSLGSSDWRQASCCCANPSALTTQNIILLRYGNRNLLVAGNGGNIFSNGLSGDLEISNSGMSPFPLR